MAKTEPETLVIIDEAWIFESLPALETALVLGRSDNIRLVLAYQSHDQVQAAFKDKPALVNDNATTQINLMPPAGLESAKRVSEMLGEKTITVESANESESRSQQEGGIDHHHGGVNVSHSSGRNWAVQARALLKPEEVLTTSSELLIAFVRDLPPIIARRIKWYEEPYFHPGAAPRKPTRLAWVIVVAVIALIAWALANQ